MAPSCGKDLYVVSRFFLCGMTTAEILLLGGVITVDPVPTEQPCKPLELYYLTAGAMIGYWPQPRLKWDPFNFFPKIKSPHHALTPVSSHFISKHLRG